MSLAPAARLGPYEIVALLGAGGMGEVYKARDTRLDRVVAIKILSAALAGDPDFRERFEREARTISQLTHPHICVLHDIGRYEDTDYLVMEFLDGESLAARIQKGPLKLDDALRIAIQVATALHAAHRVGIVHRDLKPGNVMLTRSGAKLLDFGLAKHGAGWAGRAGTAGGLGRGGASGAAQGFSAADLTAPPTMTSPLTMRGSIVGTLQYMAPEQLEGTDADARSDMFAFGALVYEMISGKKAFTGKSQVSVMAAILDQDPPSLVSLMPAAPPALDRLIRKCLAKDPEGRWQNAGDVASELEWIAETLGEPVAQSAPTAVVPAPRTRSRALTATAIVLPVLAAAATWAIVRTPRAATPLQMRFAIVPPAAQPLDLNGTDRNVAISADGTHIVYIAASGGQRQLMVRAIDQLEAVPLRGVSNPRSPFFSPDGKWIGYFDGAAELKKISITGGPPISVCRTSTPPRGAAWGLDNTIVFATADTSTGLFTVPAGGGDAKVLTKPDAAKGEQDHMFPSLLPGGGSVLFTITTGSPDTGQIAVLDLKSGQRTTVIRGGTAAEYIDASTDSGQASSGSPQGGSAAHGGYLVYAAAGSLRAVRFDPVKLAVLSDPVPVLEQVTTGGSGVAEFAASHTGVLVFVPGGAIAGGLNRTLAWIGRDGREEPIKAPPRGYVAARLSPDGTRVALTIADQENDIWVLDLSRVTLTRLTFDPSVDVAPVWTPDGRRIVFRSPRAGTLNVYWRAADGTGAEERLATSQTAQTPMAFSPDGRQLVIMQNSATTGQDIFAIAADGKGAAVPLVQTPFAENNADVSPDGRWIVYQSNEAGQPQVYVRPFPNANSGRWQVSTAGGIKPAWSPTARELFYIDPNGITLMGVPVQTTPTFSPGTPIKVLDGKFYAGGPGRNYDISRDGQKFLMVKKAAAEQTPNETPAGMVVVLNWLEELRQRVAAR